MINAKFTISGYMNTTHVSLAKIPFKKYLMPVLDEKLNILISSKNKKGLGNIVVFPWTAFPDLFHGLKQFNKKAGDTSFIILYYDHFPVGVIQTDIPRLICRCSECKAEYDGFPIARRLPKLTKFQKFVKYFFKEAFEPSIHEGYYHKCEKCDCETFIKYML